MKYLLVWLMVILNFSGCNNSEKKENKVDKIVIGASMLGMQSEFIVNLADQLQKRADELGAELILVDAEKSAIKQIEQIESFVAQKVDVIVLNPVEVEASSPAVTKALAANIPIINMNSETKAKPTAFVGSNDIESARIAMKFIAEKLAGKGNIVMLHGIMGQAAQIKREQGANEILKEYPNLKIIASQAGEWDRAKSMDITENWIQSLGTKINAVFAQNDEMAMGAVNALQAAGLKDKVIVVGIDAIADALQAVQKGELDATVFQDSKGQAFGAIETAIKIVKKQPFESEHFIPFILVKKENVADFLK